MTTPPVKFITNDTKEEMTRYIDEICSDPVFLCANKKMCGSNTTIYNSQKNVDDICNDLVKSNTCENDFSECLVNTPNLFEESQTNISTSFANIIIPIPGAFDEKANQKFLRLPALSASKKPKSKEICNICACMNRFSSSPGASKSINQNSYTSPGQNTCIYPDFIEHYYYPINIENINSKLGPEAPPIKLGKYNIINSNIIYAHSEEQLLIQNLYDLLLTHNINSDIAKRFVLQTLYTNDESKATDLQLYISKKTEKNKKAINAGFFYENITFFYVVFILFIAFILLKIV
jgi:hypothetical protein